MDYSKIDFNVPHVKHLVSRAEYKALLSLLKREREAVGLSQTELAVKLGTTQSFISKIERGERRIDVLELRAFCRALGTTIPKILLQLERVRREV